MRKPRAPSGKFPLALGLVPLLGLGGCNMLSAERTPDVSQSTRLNVAMAAEASGDNQMAMQIYATAVAKNPSDTKAVVLYARSLVNARRISLARELLTRQLQAQPGQPQLARELATIDVLQGQPAAALPRFDMALAKDPNDVRALVNKGIALDMLGNHAEAQALYRRADAITPEDPAIRSNMAMSLMLAGRSADAAQTLQNVAEGPVAVPRIRNNMAVVAASQGDMVRAKQLANGEISEAELKSLAEHIRQREALVPAPGPAPIQGASIPMAPAQEAVVAPAAPAVQPVAAAPSVQPEAQPAMQPAGGPVPLQVPESNSRRPAAEKTPPVRTEPAAQPRSRQNMTAVTRSLVASVERAAERDMIDAAISLPPALASAAARPVGMATVIPAVASTSMRIRVANLSAEADERAAGPAVSTPISSGAAAVGPRVRAARFGWGVQLGALDSEHMAQYAWRRLSGKMPTLLDGREGSIAHMVRAADGKNFWRLRTFGFESRDSAAAFCDEVKTQGVDCFPTRT